MTCRGHPAARTRPIARIGRYSCVAKGLGTGSGVIGIEGLLNIRDGGCAGASLGSCKRQDAERRRSGVDTSSMGR
eukprot:6783849-Alexandrium_andersonii.AAC.1